jgi:hypothetical protein
MTTGASRERRGSAQALLAGAFLGILPLPGPAQEEPATRPVERRLEDLERENRELRARLDALERIGAAAPEEGLEVDEAVGPGINFRYRDARATFRIFADAGFAYANPEESDQGHSAFALGTVDLFGSMQLGERVHILSETLVKKRGDETGIEQERLWASWTFSDLLYAKLGVDHSPISHWNRIYHHGEWLFTTADRPFLGQFEEGTGFLPSHFAGLELGGSLPTSLGRLEYVGTVSNGRGPEVDERQVFSDANDDKAFELGLGLAPEGAEPLQIGVAAHIDKIPENPANPAQPDPIREQIVTAYADYRAPGLEILAEGGWIRHEDTGTDETFHHRSGYVQLGLPAGACTPYTRFDIRSMRENDPYFAEADRDLDRRIQIFGVRYDLHANLAAKLELGLGRTERRHSSGDLTRDSLTTAEFQLAWVF